MASVSATGFQLASSSRCSPGLSLLRFSFFSLASSNVEFEIEDGALGAGETTGVSTFGSTTVMVGTSIVTSSVFSAVTARVEVRVVGLVQVVLVLRFLLVCFREIVTDLGEFWVKLNPVMFKCLCLLSTLTVTLVCKK